MNRKLDLVPVLKELAKTNEVHMEQMFKIVMDHKIPAQVGIPMIVDVLKAGYDSAVKTAQEDGLDITVKEALLKYHDIN